MWSDIITIDVGSKKEITTRINDILLDGGAGFHKVVWDNEGFYYAKFDEKNFDVKDKKYCKLFYRKLNEYNDKIIYEDKENPDVVYGLSITDDKRFLCLYPNFGTHLNRVLVKDLNDEDSKFKTIINDFENESEIIGNSNNHLYMITNKNSSMNKIVEIDFENETKENWKDLIKEKDCLLEEAIVCLDKIVLLYLENVSSKLKIYDTKTQVLSEIKLSDISTIFSLSYDRESNNLFYSKTSFSSPHEIYVCNLSNYETKLWKKTKSKFDVDSYETKQIWYESKDSTKIPMFITYKKSIEINKNTPLMLYGYGGFNITVAPHFSIGTALLLEQGLIFAVANIRGGSEFGEQWHAQGKLHNKQNVFDDFINAAEYLINNNYTSKEKLCIMGGSNGGLLIGATITQRPDICKVAIPIVGVLDMINFHKFGCGMDWKTDYGDPENEEDFNVLLKYSPYHNIKKDCYPSTLIMTSSNDDNVDPFHSYKFTAKLQQNQTCKNPVLLRVETKSGHQGGSSTSKRIEEITDRTCFILNELGMRWKE
jgi:prolyl oligopeptidase